MGCIAAAMLPKQARGTFIKHITKPSEQVAAPPSNVFIVLTIASCMQPDTAAALKQRGVSETLSFYTDESVIHETIIKVIYTPG